MSDHDASYWGKIKRLIDLTRKQTLLDVGANVGLVTERLYREYPESAIYSFEPVPSAFEILQSKFSTYSNVTLINLGLWDGTGEIDFEVHNDTATSSPYPRNISGRKYYSTYDKIVETISVKVESLDHWTTKAGIKHIDFIKMDTQGSELMILSGAKNLLYKNSIDIIYTEFFLVPHYQDAPLLNDLWSILSDSGYSMFDIFKGPYANNGQLRFGDAIFISDRFRNTILDS